MGIVRVTKKEFELEDGRVYPIEPSLQEDMSIEEFQKHYDFAIEVVKSCKDVGGNNSNPEKLGQLWENSHS